MTKTKKPLFIHLPKTAGTFLIQYFKKAGGVTNYGHKCAHTILTPEEWFKFAFIRNPYDWHISRFFYFRRCDMLEKGISIGCDSGLTSSAFKTKFPTFKDYIAWGEKTYKNRFWMSFRYREMCYVYGKSVLDYTGKFEDIEGSINKIYSLCNIDPKISYNAFKNSAMSDAYINKSKHRHYSHYYDKELIDIVSKKESLIIDTFGYSFEALT